MTAALTPVADWYLTQLIDHGPLRFFGAQAVILIALWCGAWAAVHVHEQRQQRAEEVSGWEQS